MNKDEPRKLWLQVYDEEGNYMDPEWRTFSADERVNPTDLCYVRWGKTNILCIERDAALARAEAAETERNRLQRELSAAVTRVAELEADYAEENRLHAEAEARAAELERVNGEFYRAYLILKEEDDAGGEPLREACRQNMILTARVAKLEAALAAERAAHQWRPVSQKPMHTLRYQVVLQHGQRFPAVDHVVYDAMSGWASPDAIYWRPIPPLPPAPPQEPTP